MNDETKPDGGSVGLHPIVGRLLAASLALPSDQRGWFEHETDRWQGPDPVGRWCYMWVPINPTHWMPLPEAPNASLTGVLAAKEVNDAKR